MKKKLAILLAATVLGLTACSDDADVVSDNLSKAADNFEINRRIVFYNGITGDYILEVDGLCSVQGADRDDEIAIVCKTGPGEYKKHFLSKSDNVTWFAEQLDAADASTDHYRVVFKPSTIVPDLDLR